MALKPAVAVAIAELRTAYPSVAVSWKEDTDGGASVVLEGLPLSSESFAQTETWVGFCITFQYPNADVYPHHVRPDLRRTDGRALVGAGIHPNREFNGRASLMLSRRTKRRGARIDTATNKLRRVLAWLERCASETST